MYVDETLLWLCAAAHWPNPTRKNASGTGGTIDLLVQSCFQYIPEPWLAPLVTRMPGEIMNQMRENQRIVHQLARGWIADKARALEVGEGHRDITTLLGEYLSLCKGC